jgi:hypothetical protein
MRGACNVITNFLDRKHPSGYNLAEQRLNRAWFGGGADIKLKALDKAVALAAAW